MTRKNDKGIAPALLALDQKIHDIARPYADHLVIRLLERWGKAGDQPPMLSLSAAVLVTGLMSERPRMMFAGTRMAAAHLLATAAKHVVKRRIDRERPAARPEGKAPRPRRGNQDSKRMTGFPSGHTAGTFAVARAFGRAYPEHAGKATGAAGLIALAQVAGRKHYLTDVLAGIVIGLAAEAAVARLAPARP
ncbi:MAG TPA: phosphatase PAP2 family protein [Allosphingosinicella sp.]